MKIYIIGIVASGKTTYSRRLSEELGIPAYELDKVVYATRPDGGQRKRSPEEQMKVLERIDAAGDWIIEGTYRQTLHCVLDMADRIIFLDPPLKLRKKRIFERWRRQRRGEEQCDYRPSLHMLHMMYRWTRDFESTRPAFEAMLENYADKLERITEPV